MGAATISENEARYLRDSEPQSATHVIHSPARVGVDQAHGMYSGVLYRDHRDFRLSLLYRTRYSWRVQAK